ncbi:hypothetical protein [Motilibacter aurantiacus]|uniref:hypothetical protein n=1 Tax=Motilibacter aurantiacus TaxID=2714955 RepID=UPI00140CCDFB|nr:hypothetical protein [Motilibacter aurantiacus]NHC45832.1 hypothetical protein [Motilibacter aurantiacus]
MTGSARTDGGDGDAAVRDELDREVRRVTERLRALALARLPEPAPPWPSRAAAAHAAAQALADAAARLEGEPLRPVPELAPSAAADLVAVCGADLVAALGSAPGRSADALVALDALRRARRAL